METTKTGRRGEDAVCVLLHNRGYQIIQRNYTIRGGEIDIIAQDGEFLAFVEVKTRRPDSMVTGFEAITKAKRARLIRTAAVWCAAHPHTLQPRFDVACVILEGKQVLSIDYLENAFDATGSKMIF